MRLFFAHYVHPEFKHVSSLRVFKFAEALAARGHEVFVLTATLNESEEVANPDQLSSLLESHDWSKPFHLPCAPTPKRTLKVMRAANTPALMRKLLIAWHYLADDGLYSDWTAATKNYWDLIISQFRPELAWSTFGNVDGWFVAQQIARVGRIPWVMDVKDGWESFMPAPFRKMQTRRFGNAAAMTTNSRFFGDQFSRWFRQSQTLIYSGVDEFWLKPGVSDQYSDEFRITLVGGVYNDHELERFMGGIASWLNGLDEQLRKKVVFGYAGAAAKRVSGIAKNIDIRCEIKLFEYLSLKDLADLCCRSAVNAYISSPTTFHHKSVELLCARKPIIAFPDEHQETRKLAKSVQGCLMVCADEIQLHESLNHALQSLGETFGDMSALKPLTWARQSRKLESLFQSVTGHSDEAA